MDLETIRDLYAYNRWANARALEAASPHPIAEALRAIEGAYSLVSMTNKKLIGARDAGAVLFLVPTAEVPVTTRSTAVPESDSTTIGCTRARHQACIDSRFAATNWCPPANRN